MIIRESHLKKKTKQFSARKSSHKSAFSLLASEKKNLFRTNYFCFLCSHGQGTNNIFSLSCFFTRNPLSCLEISLPKTILGASPPALFIQDTSQRSWNAGAFPGIWREKKYIEVISLWSYDEFLALIAQILPYSTESWSRQDSSNGLQGQDVYYQP